MMWNFWSVYMSGELKSASNRRRQLSVMFGALIWDVVLLILGAQALFRIAGYNLVYALNLPSPAYKIPSGPFYQFLAALVYNTPVLTVLILGTFLFWSLPSMIANTYMPIRSFFAWSFDRLMPEGLAKVNERTHSPVTAILTANVIIALVVIWSVYSHSFQLVLGMIVLAGALAVIIVGARGDRAAEAAAGSVPGVAGQRELVRHPGPLHHRRPVDHRVPDHHRHLAEVPGPGDERQPEQHLVDPGVPGRADRHRPAALLRAAIPAQAGGRQRRLRL